jgi:hypothetical protein
MVKAYFLEAGFDVVRLSTLRMIAQVLAATAALGPKFGPVLSAPGCL